MPARSTSDYLDVTFIASPFTFVEVPGLRLLWDVLERRARGVYLWCIEFDGAFLVNYVGKTSDKRGFEARLWTELTDWRAGRYWTPVDVEAFKRGHRIPLDDVARNHLQRELAELQPLYRILLAPIPEDRHCLQV